MKEWNDLHQEVNKMLSKVGPQKKWVDGKPVDE
jgi:hypothetical protein